MSSLKSKKKGICKPGWPSGNLALLQYLYWAKVHPLSGLDSYYFSSYPLMTNWDKGLHVKEMNMTKKTGVVMAGLSMILKKTTPKTSVQVAKQRRLTSLKI